jgi:hypothetical protein
MPFYSVPGVYPQVDDRSQFSRPSGSSPMGIVVASAKGPVDKPVLCTSPADFIRKFGNPNASYSLATYAAFIALGGDAALSGGQGVRGTDQLWVQRVHNGATWGLLSYSQTYGQFNAYAVADPDARVFPSDESFMIGGRGPGHYVQTDLKIAITNVDEVKHTFRIDVFAASNLNTPLETWTVSKRQQKDGFGRTQYLEDAVNPFSQYITVWDNAFITADPVSPGIPTPVAFTTGVDGSPVVDAQIIQAWQKFGNPDRMPLRVLINGGFSTPAVHQHMDSMSRNRIDCVAFLDLPAASQSATAAATYRNSSISINGFHSALFTPDWDYYDPRTGTNVRVPASGAAARDAAYVDSNFDVWWPLAGQDRGAIPDAMGLRYDYEFGDQKVLYDNCINPIIRDGAAGIYIDGNRMLQVDASALQSIHIARLVKFLLIEGGKVLKSLKYSFNNDRTRAEAEARLHTLMLPVKRREGVYDYRAICDGSNNPDDAIDRNEMYVDLHIKPTRDAEFIVYRIIVDRTDAVLPSV